MTRQITEGRDASIRAVTTVNTSASDQDLGSFCRAIYVGASGNVACRDPAGNTYIMVGLAPGMWHPIQTDYIFKTGTTATSILAGF